MSIFYAVRYNDPNNMTPTHCYMSHFQVFNKIYTFLKNVSIVPNRKKGITSLKNRLRILTGKKHCQIKLQRLEKVRIWAFELLVH